LVDISASCVDNNACTVDGICSVPKGGCDFSQQTANPFGANTTCNSYTCNPSLGWVKTDVSATSCVPANKCLLKYCNTNGQCVTDNNNKDNVQTGSTYSYTDQNGIVHTIQGCAMNPNDPLINCKTSGCDPSTGQCVTDVSQCGCISDASCSDGNGCTIDFCDFNKQYSNQVACVHTKIDCYSLFSNGKCNSISNPTPLTMNTDVGWSVYNGSAANSNYVTYDIDGLPYPATGVDRSCAELACYAGEPSQYECFSVQEGSYACQRLSTDCSRNGCQDNICRVLGTWSTNTPSPQVDTDCGSVFVPNCADLDACTVDQCNSSWVATDDPKLRCINTPVDVPVFCDDGNFCTKDYCDGNDTTGEICKHTLYSQWYLKKYICKTNATCTNVECTVNRCRYSSIECLPTTPCLVYICNATTKGVCKAFPYGRLKIDSCGVCGGNGKSCVNNIPAEPKKTSIIVALAVGLSVGLCFAAAIIAILTKTGYSAYSALAQEIQGTVTTASTYQGGDDHIDVGRYHNDN